MTFVRRTLAAGLALLVVSVLTVAQESREVQKTVPLEKNGRVIIDTYKGSVKVESWDKAEVLIEAKIEADDWGKYSEEKVRDTEIDIDASASSVRIKSDYRKIQRRRSSFWDLFDGSESNLPFVHYVIHMPATASLRIKDYKSESTVSGLKAALDINTYKGEVDIKRLDGGLRLETYKGECRVEFASMRSSGSLETYKGEIKVFLPSRAGFELDARVGRHGDFDSDFDVESSGGTRRNRNSSFYGKINGGGPTLRMRTDKGELRLIKD